MRALISELKIMSHLGQHLNVVNLLGAVTKDIAKREKNKILSFIIFEDDYFFFHAFRRIDGYC